MIHVVMGPPCAGKSTYVREHARPGDLVVDFDAIAATLGATGPHAADGLVRQAAFAARRAAIDAALADADSESWVIDSAPNAGQMARYEDAGADLVTVDPGMEECLSRCESDGRPEGTEERIREWYEHRKEGRHMRRTKTFGIKSDDIGNAGEFRAYASTFDREPDSYGDVVAKGAFEGTLRRHEESGEQIMFLWGHDTSDPLSNIGTIKAAGEDDTGLWVEGSFDLSGDNERAEYAYKLAKEGRVTRFSFAYDVLDEARVTLDDGTKANELRELEIFEVSLVPIPANPHAGMTDVKALGDDEPEAVAGAFAALVEAFNAAAERLEELGALLGGDEEPDEGDDAGNEEEPPQAANSEDPSGAKSRSLIDRIDIAISI